ncbi:MAG TPA: YmfQ family protein [Candidatus Hungatella pullicola]|nr:YmfQ family protein [Candidatus Hungatella pullicola]
MRLIELLPDYYEHNATMKILQEILSDATDLLDQKMDNTILECFVSTSDQLLSRYDVIFGVKTNVSLSSQARRERIMAKISGVGTTTKEMIVDVASRYSNGEVEVIEDNSQYCFKVKFVGTLGIPSDLEGLKATIEEIKPAHLAVDYEYTYNTWRDISHLTWNQAQKYTWSGIRTVNLDG